MSKNDCSLTCNDEIKSEHLWSSSSHYSDFFLRPSRDILCIFKQIPTFPFIHFLKYDWLIDWWPRWVFVLLTAFLYLRRVGVPLHWGVQASRGNRCSCRVQAFGAWASVVVVHGLGSCSSWRQLFWGMWESSWTRDWTCDPCIVRWILNCWTTRKAPSLLIYFSSINGHKPSCGLLFFHLEYILVNTPCQGTELAGPLLRVM